MKFKHFLLTRYNLGLYRNATQMINGKIVNSDCDAWMENRLKLFRQFCYPSIWRQKNQNFTWLLLFDEKTPERYIKEIERLRYKNLVIVKDKETESSRNIFTKAIKQLNNAEYLITTRIDNDDAFHKDAVKIIQENFTGQKLEALNFNYGYCWKDGRIYLKCYPNNMFCSLYEKVVDNRFNTVDTEHSYLSIRFKTKTIVDKPYWLLVMHGENLSNSEKMLRDAIEEVPIGMLKSRFLINYK